MELIDTHCHLNFEQLLGQIDDVIARSRAAGVTGWVTVATDKTEFEQVISLAGKYDGMFAAIGIHPHYAKDVRPEDMAGLREFARREKVVAIGETGLDFHYNFSEEGVQKEIFRQHLEIAAELKMPVIIHTRNAFDQTLAILDEFSGQLEKVVFHCFSEGPEQARAVLDRGWYISFTGVVTFKNAHRLREAAAIVPAERIMVETDCPYMSPEPMRKQKTNEPALMVHTAQLLADLKEMPLEQAADIMTATSKEFFGLPGS